MPPVWDAVVCKPQGLPEVAAIAAVGSGSCLSILPHAHIEQRATLTKPSGLISAAVESNMMGVEGR